MKSEKIDKVQKNFLISQEAETMINHLARKHIRWPAQEVELLIRESFFQEYGEKAGDVLAEIKVGE